MELIASDIRVDTFRVKASRICSPDTGVRLEHKPTGIVVESASERSVHSNRAKAFELLKEKLRSL